MPKAVTFGEIMLRLSPPDHLRFTQARSFDAIYGGGESNVAVALAHYGLETEFVTRLPANDLGQACLNYLRQFGVGTGHIARSGDRLGIYFLEMGAVQRGSKVIYDRADSALATIQPGMIDWESAFDGADWFHWTGITPAISRGAAETCLEAVKAARHLGVTISTDLNYRAKLWNYGADREAVMEELVSYCDVAIGNEEDAEKMFGIHPPDTDVTSGELDPEEYRYVCQQLSDRFPNLRSIAITLRGSLSASHNTWRAVLWHQAEMYISHEYDITHIVDRVGGGDSFMAGLIYGLLHYEDKQQAVNFAVAASALKHSIFGDFNLSTVDEVKKIMGGDVSGRVSR